MNRFVTISAAAACVLGAAVMAQAQQYAAPATSAYGARPSSDSYYFNLAARQAGLTVPATAPRMQAPPSTAPMAAAPVAAPGTYAPATSYPTTQAYAAQAHYPLPTVPASGVAPQQPVYGTSRYAMAQPAAEVVPPPGATNYGGGQVLPESVMPQGAGAYPPSAQPMYQPGTMPGGPLQMGPGQYMQPRGAGMPMGPGPQSPPPAMNYDPSNMPSSFVPSSMYGGGGGGNFYSGGAFDGALSGNCGDCCGTCDPCGSCCQESNWYGSLAGLLMRREEPNAVALSGFNGTNSTSLNSTSHEFDYQWGAEARVGRLIGNHFAVEGVYWSLLATEENHMLQAPGNNLSAWLDFGNVTADGVNLGTIYNNSSAHYVERRNEIHNAEVNFLSQPMGACSSYGCTLLTGFRFFRFDEGLAFAAAQGGTVFGDADGQASAIYDIDVENNLYGGQVGARCFTYLMPSVRLHATPVFGVFGNQIDHRTQLYLGNKATAFNIESEKDELSLLGQLDVGATVDLGDRWSVFATYRVLTISNVALSDEQIPESSLLDAGDIADIDSKGNLILHGFVLGGQVYF